MRPPRMQWTPTAVLLATLSLATPAAAHISLEQGGTHMSRYGDGEIKDAPCGRLNGTRGTNVYTYAPGETITVTINEFIPHPGYFRIAFDDDGDDDFVDPASIDPISRDCLADPADQCGATDFFNNDAVLMDNLEPHTSGGGVRTFEVTLPNVECDNCTLQIIQVMEDAIHGPYNPSNSGVGELFYIEDVYHTCIDLVLTGEPVGGGDPDPGTGGTGGEMMVGTGGSGGTDVAPPDPSVPPTSGTGGSDPSAAGSVGVAGMDGVAGSGQPMPAPGPTAGTAGTAPLPPGGTATDSGSGDDGGCSVGGATDTHATTPLLLLLSLLWLGRRRNGV